MTGNWQHNTNFRLFLNPGFYFEEARLVHFVCYALVSRRHFITSRGREGEGGGGRGALYLVFIRSKVDRRLRVICKHKTLNQANVGAGRLISPKYTSPFPVPCYIICHISILLSVSIDPK